MNPHKQRILCDNDQKRCKWLYSIPVSKAPEAVYENFYRCPQCGAIVILKTAQIAFDDPVDNLDYGALG